VKKNKNGKEREFGAKPVQNPEQEGQVRLGGQEAGVKNTNIRAIGAVGPKQPGWGLQDAKVFTKMKRRNHSSGAGGGTAKSQEDPKKEQGGGWVWRQKKEIRGGAPIDAPTSDGEVKRPAKICERTRKRKTPGPGRLSGGKPLKYQNFYFEPLQRVANDISGTTWREKIPWQQRRKRECKDTGPIRQETRHGRGGPGEQCRYLLAQSRRK